MKESAGSAQGSSLQTDREHGAFATEAPLVPLLKRYQVQVLVEAGCTEAEVGEAPGLSVRGVPRIAAEPTGDRVDNRMERLRRGIGRPSLAEPVRAFVMRVIEKEGRGQGRRSCPPP